MARERGILTDVRTLLDWGATEIEIVSAEGAELRASFPHNLPKADAGSAEPAPLGVVTRFRTKAQTEQEAADAFAASQADEEMP